MVRSLNAPYKLWIFPIENSENIGWEGATPIPPVEEWPNILTPLSDLMRSTNDNYAIFEGESLLPVLNLFSIVSSGRVFTENNNQFYVVTCPILP